MSGLSRMATMVSLCGEGIIRDRLLPILIIIIGMYEKTHYCSEYDYRHNNYFFHSYSK